MPLLQPNDPMRLTRFDGHYLTYDFDPPHHATMPIWLFLPGFMSDRLGVKATSLGIWCREIGHGSVRMDYFGHGGSSGKARDGTIGRWRDDVVAMIDYIHAEFPNAPLFLVGSSMGGWLMLLASLLRPKHIAGLIGLAAAPDFTERLIYNHLNDHQRHTLQEEGEISLANDYCSAEYRITKLLIEEARDHLLLTNNIIPIHHPISLLAGMADQDVPYEMSIELAKWLASDQIELYLHKKGDHRLSDPRSLQLFYYLWQNFVE
jgi:pimeloyl-ACP methyl ester carboxylesterase